MVQFVQCQMRNAKFVKDGKETDHLGLNRLALVSGEKRVGRKTSCAAYNSPPCHFFLCCATPSPHILLLLGQEKQQHAKGRGRAPTCSLTHTLSDLLVLSGVFFGVLA